MALWRNQAARERLKISWTEKVRVGSTPTRVTKRKTIKKEDNKFIDLEKQILETENELNSYKKSKYSSPDIIEYLESVLISLKDLKKYYWIIKKLKWIRKLKNRFI